MGWLGDRTISHLRDLPEAVDLHGRYELFEELGRGGMGTVFRAFDRELEREIAVKVLGSHAPGVETRLRQEARILGRLEHPGIVPIHDIGTLDSGQTFYAMKLVRGERLDRHAARDLPLSDRLQIIDRLCDAVAFAHAHGVIHRDLKPENVMIGAFGDVVVLDWGVAKIRGGMPDHGAIVGTPEYMAPEQAAGDAAGVDERADVFGVGGIMALLLPNPPPALAAIIQRARRREPAERYASVTLLAADIRRYAAGLAVNAYHEGMVERLGRVARRYRIPLLAAATDRFYYPCSLDRVRRLVLLPRADGRNDAERPAEAERHGRGNYAPVISRRTIRASR